MLQVGLPIFVRTIEWAMGGIRANVGKERIVVFDTRLNKALGFLEIDISAVAFVFFRLAVVPIGVVEIRVVPVVWSLAYASTPMAHYFRKTSILGSLRIIVA